MSTNLDRYDEAFEDADRAQRAYERLSDPGTGLAEVKLTRAFLYYRLGRSSESLPLAQSAADEYERRRDMRKYAEAIETAASLLYMMGEYPPALKMYLRNLEAADELRDTEMRARILHNVSLVYRRVGDLDNAGKYLFDALHIWEGLGMKAAVARGRWSIGILALASADFAAAENVLRAAIDALREVGAEALAADAKVDLAEALLMLGRPQEIETLCREVEECYARLGLSRGRLSAAGFLRNAAADQILRREDIQHVRTYLEQSRERSDTHFPPASRN
jgi:tetratricopeptide (TPR) repeat protein